MAPVVAHQVRTPRRGARSTPQYTVFGWVLPINYTQKQSGYLELPRQYLLVLGPYQPLTQKEEYLALPIPTTSTCLRICVIFHCWLKGITTGHVFLSRGLSKCRTWLFRYRLRKYFFEVGTSLEILTLSLRPEAPEEADLGSRRYCGWLRNPFRTT